MVSMPARRIRELGDPVLRAVSRPVADPAEAAPVLEDLRDTLDEFRRTHGFGRGISAVQIGEPLRVIYLEFEGAPICLTNPRLEFESAERIRLWDDCFSFPDLMVHLERAARIRVRYQDENGDTCAVEASGALSELLQHELDHLDGILAVDRAIDRNSLKTRAEYLRRSDSPETKSNRNVLTGLGEFTGPLAKPFAGGDR
jgi:peptide deformylase